MTQRTKYVNPDLLGFPVLIFQLMQNYNRGTRKHLERKIDLEIWYSYLRAFIPVKHEKDPELLEQLMTFLYEICNHINDLDKMYNSSFDTVLTSNPADIPFGQACRAVHERLSELTARAHIIDAVAKEEEQLSV